ncbi:MAG: DEAD/DEAH box helicase [Oscillospiraceae bacterium]|nr:DEAD/DEAH box helicase [Oscillospiraceae bacterium]
MTAEKRRRCQKERSISSIGKERFVLTDFNINIMPEIQRALDAMGFTALTEIQQNAIPVMQQGKDIIAKAPTGTGKTVAFGIPIIEKIDRKANHPQAVILAPTRELAMQIRDELRELCQFLPGVRLVAATGGMPMGRQIEGFKKGAQIIVATPGRLLDHMKRRNVNLNKVTTIVLDEADEMLSMGFYQDVKKLLDSMPARQQVAMFSATISREVMDIGWMYQRDAEEVTVRPVEESRPQIKQYIMKCMGRQKLANLCSLMESEGFTRVMVFCNTKYTTARLSEQLAEKGLKAECIHGDMKQSECNAILAKFKEGKFHMLIATDVAARGIDVDDVEAVFNYDMPQENEYYIHRIGRTGRAQKQGVSYLFYSAEEESKMRRMLTLTRSEVIELEPVVKENMKLVDTLW